MARAVSSQPPTGFVVDGHQVFAFSSVAGPWLEFRLRGYDGGWWYLCRPLAKSDRRSPADPCGSRLLRLGNSLQLKNWGRFQRASMKVLPHDRILTPRVVSSTV